MVKRFLIGIIFCLFLGLLSLKPVFAQTTRLTPQSLEVEPDSNFSLTLSIESVSNLFGIAFDLDFNPSLVSFVSVDEGAFLSQGCQTSLMTAESPVGKLIIGLARLGASCGGVSGSGTLMTFNFNSLQQTGTNNFSFSNNSLCLLSGNQCNYVTGSWLPSSVTITSGPTDTTPPVRSNGLPSGTLPAGTTQTTLSLSTDEAATCKYSVSSGISYNSMANTFSTTGGISHSVSLLGLSNGNDYDYYIRCQDTAGNANTDDYHISFSVGYTADLNQDGLVNSVDFGIIMSYWGFTSRPAADINQDGYVNSVDFGIMMSQWG